MTGAAPEAGGSADAEARAALARWRAAKDRWLKESPDSPIGDRAAFAGLSYWPYDPARVYRVPLQMSGAGGPGGVVELVTSTGDRERYRHAGRARLAGLGSLALFEPLAAPGRLFLPFRDGTSGRSSYGAGRYLEPQRLPGDRVRIDFNYAYQPFCAYADGYRCPLPPAENALTPPVEAGERLPRGAP